MPIGIGIVVFILDQLVKIQVQEHMYLGESIPVIDDIFYITYVLNPGAAFGVLENQRYLFVIVAMVVIGLAIKFYRAICQEGPFFATGCGLLLGGAAGNLLDRLQTGLVIDFIDFKVWPVFNIADIAICLGAGMILLDMWKRKDE